MTARSAIAGSRAKAFLARSMVATLSVVLVQGCATVTFKRGQSPGGMAADESACRAEGGDDAAFVQCMRAKGWFVAGGVAEVADAASVTVGEAAPVDAAAPTTATQATGVVATHGEAPAPMATADSAPAAEPAGKEAPSVEAAPAAPAQPRPSKAAPAPTSPDAKSNVASWWKLGGSAAGLELAVGACVGELGESHRPDPAVRVASAAMIACLRRAGWYPVGVSPVR